MLYTLSIALTALCPALALLYPENDTMHRRRIWSARTLGERVATPSHPSGANLVMVVGSGEDSHSISGSPASASGDGQWLTFVGSQSSPWSSSTALTRSVTQSMTAVAAYDDSGYGGNNNLVPRDQREAWVNGHTTARAQNGAGQVWWRDDLAVLAQANARLCTGQHSNTGENIAAQSGGLTPQQAIDMWMSEKPLYKGYYEEATGHYSQVVWKATQHIGCFIQQCQPGTLFDASYGTSYQATCEYDPHGNNVAGDEMAKNVQMQ